MKSYHLADPGVKPLNEQIQELAQQLAETESVLQSLTSGNIDAVVDPTSGAPILLRAAQAELRRAHNQLEQRVQERTTELKRSNRLMQALIETMPVGVVIADSEGKLLSTNAAGREILGSEVFGTLESPERPYVPLHLDGSPMPPDDMPLMQAIKKGITVSDVEIRLHYAKGPSRTISAGASPVLDESGQVVGGVTVFQDITEANRIQATLRRYNDRFKILHDIDQAILSARSVKETAYSALCFVPQLIDCIRCSIKLFHRDTAEMSVLAVYSESETEIKEGWRNPLPDANIMEQLRQGYIYAVKDLENIEPTPLIKGLLAEGVRAYVNVPLIVQGELVGSLNLGMDSPVQLDAEQEEIAHELTSQLAIAIQQSRLIEELQQYAIEMEKKVSRRTAALQASEARFRTIFEDSVLGIALLNSTAHTKASNPALQTMLGFSEKEISGTPLSNYFHPDDAKDIKELFRALATKGLGYYQIEKQYVRKDGQTRWCQLTVTRVKESRQGKTRQSIAMLEDITEKKMNQETLLKAERLTIAGQLGASLAHEINNPLQSVIGFLGLAEETMDDGTDVQRYLEIAMEELERAAGIVTQLRDLSRDSKIENKEYADLNTLVEKAVLLTKKRCQNRNVKVEWRPADDLPQVFIAPDTIIQVFLNLILNAVEAMPEGGRLLVCSVHTNQPDGIQTSFSDTGVGIEPDRLKKIFEPFHSSRPDGLGLGLYISKNIIDEHDGKIEVISHCGEGTKFNIWLPAKKARTIDSHTREER